MHFKNAKFNGCKHSWFTGPLKWEKHKKHTHSKIQSFSTADMNVKGMVQGALAGAGAGEAGAPAEAAEVQEQSVEKKEEKPEEPEYDSEEDDFGLSLFD